MALTVVGLRSKKGLIIHDAHHVAKSYPQYFDHLRSIGAQVELVSEDINSQNNERVSQHDGIIWQGLKVTFGLFLVAGLVFASSVFAVLLYAKANG